jgi:adenylosuccinate lyase
MRENIELTHGLVFSQRTLIALIEKGMTRQDAYKVVQTNAMDAWNNNKDFRSLLESDATVKENLSTAELDAIFDYGFYTREVDRIFERAGITGEAGPLDASSQRLAPHSY